MFKMVQCQKEGLVRKQADENLPDIYFLSKEIRVVQVSNCTIHRIAVSHFYHGGSRLTFHEFNLWKEEDCSKIQEYHITSLSWNSSQLPMPAKRPVGY